MRSSAASIHGVELVLLEPDQHRRQQEVIGIFARVMERVAVCCLISSISTASGGAAISSISEKFGCADQALLN